MSLPRLDRLFAADGRCVILAFDHGIMGEASWMAGNEDLPKILSEHAREGPDGMTLPTGSARVLRRLVSSGKPALVLRADTTNAFLSERPQRMRAYALAGIVERAVALDAVCVVAGLLTFPGQPDLRYQCLVNIDGLRAACDQAGLALMVETLANTANEGVPKVSAEARTIAPLVRQAFELGADVIKADPTEPAPDFAAIVQAAAGVPVLASGGVKASDEIIIRRTADLMAAGARGVAYGRNVLWAAQPTRMTRALIDVVHGGRQVEHAIASAGMPTEGAAT